MEAIGLSRAMTSFDVEAHALDQRGRPDGFSGLVLETPRGIPILVSEPSFRDSVLRRVGRGNDLFFQVRKGSGSRVLLRTSMIRSLAKSPRECMEMAADVAAYFCAEGVRWPPQEAEVEVMFTDARHVAKRGTRVGQLKDKKKLGTIVARPRRVAEMVRDAQEEQGWLDAF